MRILGAAMGALLVALVQAPLAAAQQGDDEDLQRAVLLFEESENLYNQGDFEEAATLLRRAYELQPDPTLLFNLARALEGAGDLDGAIETYERYLAEAEDAEDAGAIRQRVATLRDQRDRLAAVERGDRTEEPDPESSEASSDTPEPPDAGGGGGVEVFPWIVAGVGLAGVGVGVGLGVLALDYGDRAQQEPTMARAVELQDEGQTYALVANVLFIAGGVVAAAGIVWGVITLVDGGGDEPEAALELLPGGARVSGSF